MISSLILPFLVLLDIVRLMRKQFGDDKGALGAPLTAEDEELLEERFDSLCNALEETEAWAGAALLVLAAYPDKYTSGAALVPKSSTPKPGKGRPRKATLESVEAAVAATMRDFLQAYSRCLRSSLLETTLAAFSDVVPAVVRPTVKALVTNGWFETVRALL